MTTVERELPQYQTRPYPITEGVPPPSSSYHRVLVLCQGVKMEVYSSMTWKVELSSINFKVIHAPPSASAGHMTRVYLHHVM